MKFFFCLFLFFVIFQGAGQLRAGESQFYIDSDDSTLIRQKIDESKSQIILGASDLPQQSTLHPRAHFAQQKFSYLAANPDQSILAFSVEAGPYDWSGLYFLATKELKQMSLRIDSKALAPSWSSNGRFLVFEEEDSNQRRSLEIFDLEKGGHCTLEGRDAKNKFLNFLNPWWSEQGDKIYFRVDVNNVYRQAIGLKPIKEVSRIGEASPKCQKLVLRSVAKFMTGMSPEASPNK